jgi:hypothetical protein
LSIVYRDSFQAEEPDLRLKYQQQFVSAQETLCIQQGLPGGYREYLWVMNSLGNPRNKALRDSLGLSVF